MTPWLQRNHRPPDRLGVFVVPSGTRDFEGGRYCNELVVEFMLNKYWDVLRVIEQVGVGHVTVLDQWGGIVWDNRLSLAGLLAGQWWRRKGSEEDEVVVGIDIYKYYLYLWLLECQSEEQEVWHVCVDFNKVTDKRRSSVSSVKRGRYIGTRRFRVRGQRTPEVNKVALTAFKYFIALISATIIS